MGALTNEWSGRLKLGHVTPATGNLAVDEDIRPPAQRNWLIYSIWFANSDGANRTPTVTLTDGTAVPEIARRTDLPNGSIEVILGASNSNCDPEYDRPIRITNSIFLTIATTAACTDRADTDIYYLYSDLGVYA